MLQYFHVQHLTGAAFSAKYGIKLKAKKYDYSYMFHPFFDKKKRLSIVFLEAGKVRNEVSPCRIVIINYILKINA